MARKKNKTRKQKNALRRQRKPIHLLTGVIALFQASAFLLISLKDGAVDTQALLLAAIMPALYIMAVLPETAITSRHSSMAIWILPTPCSDSS